MSPTRNFTLVTVLIYALAFCPVNGQATRIDSEAHMASASSAYHTGDFPAALKALDSALKLNPTDPRALELLALTLKAQSRFPEALKIYRSLIQLSKLENGPEISRAPYIFESAVIEFSQGQFRKAAVNFLTARKAGFNTDAAMFFQGLCRYREGDVKGATKIWEQVTTQSKTSEITASAYYYLARAALDQKLNASAADYLRQAEKASEGQTGELAVQIRTAAQSALKDATETHFLAGIETLSEYDSNALLLSDDLKQLVKPSTFRQSLVAALAMGKDRGLDGAWHIGFRSIINYNTNKETKSAEFAANEIDGAWMFAKFGRFRAGPMARALALFRNQSESGGQEFRTYLLAGAGGLAIESVTGKNLWRLESTAGNARFLDDADMEPIQRRTGLTADAGLSWRQDQESGRLNPFARIEAAKQWTDGTEYRGTHARLTVGNKFYLGRWTLVTQGGAGASEYEDRPTEKRSDKIYFVDALGSRAFSESFALLLRLGVAANQSSLEELYSYQRQIAGLGLRYIF